MGDRSPKSNEKRAAQKQAKADVHTRQKQQVIATQQAAKLAAAGKRK